MSALASVPPGDVIDVLKADEALTVALLADLNPRKAKELIGLLQGDWPWLAALPEAAEAITRRAAELKWDHDEGAGVLEHVGGTTEDFGGYAQRYLKGWVCFSDSKTHAISNAIADFYADNDGPRGPLRFPVGEEEPDESSFGTTGAVQEFDEGGVYATALGSFFVSGDIVNKYNMELEYSRGWLGFPVSNIEDYDGYSVQRFEGGSIYSSQPGVFPVRQAILERLDADDIPSSDEAEATSPFATTGATQPFRSHSANWESLVCRSEAHGTYALDGRTLDLYLAWGGPASQLGFPVSGAEIAPPESGGWIQRFEGGVIVEGSDQTIAHAVPADTVALISGVHDGDLFGCGLPVSEEQPIGTDSGDHIQFFEDAVVTLREGKRELWPRPS